MPHTEKHEAERLSFLSLMLSRALFCLAACRQNGVFAAQGEPRSPRTLSADAPFSLFAEENIAALSSFKDSSLFCSARELLTVPEVAGKDGTLAACPLFRFARATPLPIGVTLSVSPFAFYYLLLLLSEEAVSPSSNCFCEFSVRTEAASLIFTLKAPLLPKKEQKDFFPFLEALARSGNMTLRRTENAPHMLYTITLERTDDAAFSLLQLPKAEEEELSRFFLRLCGGAFGSAK